MAWMVMSSWILGWLSGYPVIPTRPNGRPSSSSRSSSGSAPSNGPAGWVASPPGTNTSSTPDAVSRATISSRCAWLATERAARCGTTRYPRAASFSASSTVGSSPLTGEAAQQEVGEHVGARLGAEHGCYPVGAREHVVAVQPGQPAHAVPGAQLVQRAVGPAVGVGQGDGPARCEGGGHGPFGLYHDLLR